MLFLFTAKEHIVKDKDVESTKECIKIKECSNKELKEKEKEKEREREMKEKEKERERERERELVSFLFVLTNQVGLRLVFVSTRLILSGNI